MGMDWGDESQATEAGSDSSVTGIASIGHERRSEMPILTQYDQAILLPQMRFKDAALKRGAVDITATILANGQVSKSPFKASGSFAVVYKYRLQDENGRPLALRAIRCWFNPAAVDSARQLQLREYLQAHAQTIAIDYRYLHEGIRLELNGEYYPVFDMEWVDGQELRQQVAELADCGDRFRLHELANTWLALIARMRDAHIAHGDLSGANAMTRRDGTLVLVDYDGMYIPPFAGEQREVSGVDGYQRPGEKRSYGEDMDRFSALLIYVALCAVGDCPELWRAYTKYSSTEPDRPESDQLLFQADDLRNPDGSALFRDLKSRCSSRTQKLADALHRACVLPLAECPDVLEIADPERDAKLAYSALQEAIQSGDNEATVRCAEDPALYGYEPARAPAVAEAVSRAREQVHQLGVLKQALADENDALVLEIWQQVSEYPWAQPYSSAYEVSLKRSASIARLRQSIADDDAVQTLLLAHELQGSPALTVFQRDIDRAAAIIRRLDQMEKAIAAKNDQEVMQLWGAMLAGVSGRADPELERYRLLAGAAAARVRMLPALVEAAQRQDDQELARLEPLFAGYPIAQAYLDLMRQASQRVAILPELAQALREWNDADALRIWDQYAYDDKPIAASLRPEIEEARRRWIDHADPREVVAEIRATLLAVRWHWPEDVTLVAVAVRTNQFAEKPEMRVTGALLARNTRCMVDSCLRCCRCRSILFGCSRSWPAVVICWSLGLHPEASVQLSGDRSVYYSGGPAWSEVDGPLFLLHIWSADGRPLPPMRVVARREQRVLSEDGSDNLALYEVNALGPGHVPATW